MCYWLARNKPLRLACEHFFGIIELLVQVLFIYSHLVWGLITIMFLVLYFHVLRGCSVLTPKGSTSSQILNDLSLYSYYLTSKKELMFNCNTAWPMYILDFGKKYPLNAFLNYCTIMKLELLCHQSGKWYEIPYHQVLMPLLSKDSTRKSNHLMMQKRKWFQNPSMGVRHKKKMSLFNVLKPGHARPAIGRLFPSPLLLLDTPEIGPRRTIASPMYEKGMVSL